MADLSAFDLLTHVNNTRELAEPVTPRQRLQTHNARPGHPCYPLSNAGDGPSSPLPPSSPLAPLTSSPLVQPLSPSTLRPRASSLPLPPLSSDDIVWTSPIVGSREQCTAKSRAKGFRKRTITIEAIHQNQQLEKHKVTEDAKEAAENAEQEKLTFFDSIISSLKTHQYTLGDLLLYVSNPIYKHGKARWEGLFQDRRTISDLLELWAFQGSSTARNQVCSWAVNYISKAITQEAREITSSGFLQTLHRPVDSSLILGFNITTIHLHLQQHGPVFMQVLRSLATSACQMKKASSARIAKKITVFPLAFHIVILETNVYNFRSSRQLH